MFSWIKILILGQKDNQSQNQAQLEKTLATQQAKLAQLAQTAGTAGGLDADDIGNVFGQPLTQPIPIFLSLIIQTIEEKGLEQEGLFRKSGLHNRKKEYIRAINQGEKINFNAEPDVHTLVSVLKKYLELMPDPILTYGLYSTLIEWVHQESNPESLQKILTFLPPAHYEFSKMFFRLLHKTYMKAAINKMDSRNLANVLKPNVLKPPMETGMQNYNGKNPANDLKLMFVDEFECKKLMKILIEEYEICFGEISTAALHNPLATVSNSNNTSPVLNSKESPNITYNINPEVKVTIDTKKLSTNRCTERIVGIDLGTTFTKMAVKEGSNIHIFSTMGTANRVPSVVCYVLKPNSEKIVYVGEQAKEKYLFQHGKNDTAFLVTQSKRILGLNRWSQTVLSVEESLNYDVVSDDFDRAMIRMRKFDENGTFFDLYPQQVAAEILKHMRAIYEQKYGTTSQMRAIITVPAIYNEIQRRATLEAAIIAGIDVEKLISEPNAASVKHLHSFIEYKKQEAEKLKNDTTNKKQGNNNNDKSNNEKGNLTKFEILGEAEVDGYYLVFDFGGGTLDLTLIEVSQWAKKYSVLATGGNARLGGCDIDDLLFKFFYSQLEKKFRVKLDNSPMLTMKEKLRNNKSLLKLLKECERVKQELTINQSSEIQLEQFMTKEQLKSAVFGEEEEDNSPTNNNNSKKNKTKKIISKHKKGDDSDNEDDSNSDDDSDNEDEKVLTITIDEFKNLMEKSWIKKQLLKTLEDLFNSTSRGGISSGKKILPMNINSVLLAGGSSQIPIVKDWLFKFFPKGIMILVPTQMDHVVCQGAAILGHSCLLKEKLKLSGNEEPANKNEYSLESVVEARDVIPFTLGIECAGDEIWPMINKFSRLPAKETEIFETPDSSLSLLVKQGDSEVASECETLTIIDICGLSPSKYSNSDGSGNSNKVSVTFLVDKNGVFSIEAFDVNNPDNHLMKVVSTKGRFSENDIQNLKNSIDSTIVSFKEGGVGRRLNEMAKLVYKMEYAIRSIGKTDVDAQIREYYSPICQKYLNFVHDPHDSMMIEDINSKIQEVENLIQKIKDKKIN